MFKKILAGWVVLWVCGLGAWTTQAAPVIQPGGCGDPATQIHAVQGKGERSPLDGRTVTVEGVVVGDFQARDTQLGGFFIQEEAADTDSDAQTSEGLFVFDPDGPEVNAGNVVRVTGMVAEWNSSGVTLTELKNVSAVTVCHTSAPITPTPITLPLADRGDWERYEGMLVTFSQTLTVTDLADLGQYGEVLLSSGGRLFQPTNVARPGAAANAVADENARRSIILDDSFTRQYIDPIQYPAGGLSASRVLRSGDTVSGLTGVVDQRFGSYRVQPSVKPTFSATNPRSETPPDVGGRLRVASFNVLNYFNGSGTGGGFPTERGASSAAEFDRQRAKIFSAILALDADVVGLLEIENDGDGRNSAVADLVDGLNETAGQVVFAYVPDPAGFKVASSGGDVIKPAFIYRVAAVTPVGEAVAVYEQPFGQRRPSIAQAFEEKTTGERFILVVNHFKSKGCEGADAAGDGDSGQGCWNRERTQAARVLTGWLATDPTGTGEADVLLIGDLNAYAQEDPLRVLADAGFMSLVVQFEGAGNYSYVFEGQAGSLDHALASASLFQQVTGAQTWPINADEPPILDYNVENKSARQVASLYSPDPFRSSDHDPVVIGLELGAAIVHPTAMPTVPPTKEPSDGSEGDGGLADSGGGLLVIILGVIVIIATVISRALGQQRRTR